METKEAIVITEIVGETVLHSESGICHISNFPTTPKVGQEWIMTTEKNRIIGMVLVKDIKEVK